MLPAEDLIDQGIAHLARGVDSIEAVLVSIGAPRLRRIGIRDSLNDPLSGEKALRAARRVESRLGPFPLQRPHSATCEL